MMKQVSGFAPCWSAGARDIAVIPPQDGERVLFCEHAKVSEEFIDISAKACVNQPFHWYYVGPNEVMRNDGRTFPVRWLVICNFCNMSKKDPPDCAAQDGPWIGSPPVIHIDFDESTSAADSPCGSKEYDA
jgi:hypothetical protein